MRKILLITLLISTALCNGCGRHGEAAPEARLTTSGDTRIISNFENLKTWDISPETGFTLTISNETLIDGKRSLKVVYPVEGLPSINTKKLPREWGNYDSLRIDIFNPQSETLDFAVRLDDTNKKRFNQTCLLEPGMNNISIPRENISKAIDAGNIYRVVLYLKNPKKRMTLNFLNMYLAGPGRPDALKAALPSMPKRNYIYIKDETFEPVQSKCPLPLAGTIKISIAKLCEMSKSDILVSSGVPFAAGQLFDEKNFSIFDEAGKELPIAVKILGRWPQDGSIRSLLVQFPAEVKRKYKQIYMRWGEPRTTKDLNIVDISWVVPDGIINLPPDWLCLSGVTGPQIAFGKHDFQKYDTNIDKNFPKIRDTKWTGDVGTDNYYGTPHVFYQLYARTGDDEFFKAARKETIHYRDDELVQEGPERGRATASKKTRNVYVQAMIDDYLLTGDPKSLSMAGSMVEYLKNSYPAEKAFFPKTAKHFWTEREAAFPLIGVISYYELLGRKEDLEYSGQLVRNLYKTQNEWPDRGGFIHNLYSHDTEEGARPDEYGGSPFMTGLLLEGIVKYHRLTGSNIAKDSIFRALDWLENECVAPDGDSFVYMTCDARKGEGHPDLNMLIAHAFGYGYKISGYTRNDYLELGTKIFDAGTSKARLSDRKHFNQNYRSSGHFLAYIKK